MLGIRWIFWGEFIAACNRFNQFARWLWFLLFVQCDLQPHSKVFIWKRWTLWYKQEQKGSIQQCGSISSSTIVSDVQTVQCIIWCTYCIFNHTEPGAFRPMRAAAASSVCRSYASSTCFLILIVLAIWSLSYWNATAAGEFKLPSCNINCCVVPEELKSSRS